MPGLDPGIHAYQLFNHSSMRHHVDGRVKPGHGDNLLIFRRKICASGSPQGARSTPHFHRFFTGSIAGFTLLEVLVGLVVLGMLMVGLAQGLQYGFKVWDSQASFIAQRDRLDAVDRALRQLIGQIDTRDQETPALFVGSANHFDFTTELPTALSFVSRRADASLLVDEHRLILRWTPHLHATRLKDPPRPTDTELLSGVERVEFRYWKAADTGGIPAGWLSDWNDPQPPELVKIHLVFAPGDPRHWPDIIAARQLDMSTP
jgi:general secretion pathway protein J